MMEAEVTVMQLLALKMESGHRPRNAGDLQKQEKQRMDSPLEPPKGKQPYQHFDFSSVRPIFDF